MIYVIVAKKIKRLEKIIILSLMLLIMLFMAIELAKSSLPASINNLFIGLLIWFALIVSGMLIFFVAIDSEKNEKKGI
jgi:hypothetical protein